MGLREKLQEDLHSAIREGNVPKRSALRLVISAITYAESEVAKKAYEQALARGKSEDEAARSAAAIDKASAVDDNVILDLIAREARQHRDSIEAFTKGKREDLVPKERAELVFLEAYLPSRMGRDELVEAARKVIAEMGASGPADKGKVMQRLMPLVKAKAEGKDVNEVVTQLLSGKG